MCCRYQSDVHVPGVQAQVQCTGALVHRCTGTVYQQVILQVRGSSGRHTDPVPAINYLKAHGVRIAVDNPIVINLISKTLGYLVLNSYESPLLTPAEQRIVGNLNISPAVNWAGTSSKDYSEAFLYHPLLGQNTPYSNDEVHSISGCDFCGFTFYFDNHLRFFDYSRVAINPLLGSFMWDMSCLFLKSDSKCPGVVREFKQLMSRPSVPRVSEWQYSNTPSCEPTPFGERYWGSHYPRLLQLKQMWDPTDVFHHCHSVGSQDQNCCPY